MKRSAYALALFGAVLAASGVSAATMSWITASGGTFADGANWSGGNAPVAADTAVFNLGSVAGYTVDFAAAAASTTIQVNTDKVALTLGGNIYTLSSGLFVGNALNSTAQLAIDGGTLQANLGRLGQSAGASGTLAISNGGRLITSGSGSNVHVGSAAGSTGSLTVSTGTSTEPGLQTGDFLVVGHAGSGTFRADNHAFVKVFRFYMARESYATGAATITDGAVVQASYQSNLGGDVHHAQGTGGTGTLLISNGGTLSAEVATIGYGATSNATATVTGAGSLWTTISTLDIGNTTGGTGRLTLADNGQFRAGRVTVHPSGTLILNGGTLTTTSMWSTSNFNGQVSGNGTLDMISAAGYWNVTGTLAAAGGTLQTLDAQASRSWTGAALGAGPGATLAFRATGNGNVTLTSGRVFGSGTLDVGTLTMSGGTLAPGTSTGVLTIAGNLTLDSATTSHFELGGTTPGTGHDALSVSGTATLGGSQLRVELVDGFEPLKADQLTIITAGTLSGTFNPTPLLAPSDVLHSLTVDTTSVSGSVILTDFDLFPIADLALTPLGGGLFEFNASASYDPDDGPAPGAGIDAFAWTINGDGGFAEADDMVFTRSLIPGFYAVTLQVQDDESNWSSLASLNLTIPEPSSLLLLGLSGLALVRRPRRIRG